MGPHRGTNPLDSIVPRRGCYFCPGGRSRCASIQSSFLPWGAPSALRSPRPERLSGSEQYAECSDNARTFRIWMVPVSRGCDLTRALKPCLGLTHHIHAHFGFVVSRCPIETLWRAVASMPDQWELLVLVPFIFLPGYLKSKPLPPRWTLPDSSLQRTLLSAKLEGINSR